MPYLKSESPTSMTRRKFADNLSDVINESGKSIREISEETGIATGTLSKYQNDGAEAGIDKLAKLADYFDVSADWLLGRTDTRSVDPNKQAVCEYLDLSETAVDALRPDYDGGKLDGARRVFFDLLLNEPDFAKFIDKAFQFSKEFHVFRDADPDRELTIYGNEFKVPITVENLKSALITSLMEDFAPIIMSAFDSWQRAGELYYSEEESNDG